jgi:hypothetical protein
LLDQRWDAPESFQKLLNLQKVFGKICKTSTYFCPKVREELKKLIMSKYCGVKFTLLDSHILKFGRAFKEAFALIFCFNAIFYD